MAENPKAAWPKTPDGTTDWEVVFEDSSSGLIPLISQAQSAEALQMVATTILRKLFTRKNDADERTRLIAQLNALIVVGGNLEQMIEDVAALMREVKDERIEKARLYVERKRAGATIDRRAGLFWKIDNLLKPIVLIPVGAVFVIVLSGLVYLMLQSTLGPRTEVADAPPPAEQAAEDEAAQAELLPPEADPLAPEPEPEPLPIWFQTLRWPLTTKYTTERPQYYSVTLYVMSFDHKTEICLRLPTVMDRFYLSFSEAMPLNRAPRKEEIQTLESEIKAAINAILPDSYVTDAAVARYGTREFRAAVREPYCTSPNRPAPQKAP